MTQTQDLALLTATIAGRSFLSTKALGTEAFAAFLRYAAALKSGAIPSQPVMQGLAMPLVFFNPSLRTRASMAVAVHQLGGLPLPMDIGAGGGVWGIELRDGVVMDGVAAEHVREAAPVLGAYGAAIGVRCFAGFRSLAEDLEEPVLGAWDKFAGKPLVNLESATEHPCQALADMLTVQELFGDVRGKKLSLVWANHPKALPLAVPHSFALAAAQCGADLTIAAPEEYMLPPEMLSGIEAAAAKSGGKVRLRDRHAEAHDGAHVVYAKSWSSPKLYGNAGADLALRSFLKDWMVSEASMERTAQSGVFMHCLPTRRNVVVADGVLDGPRSRVVQQAANRLHAQKALLSLIFAKGAAK